MKEFANQMMEADLITDIVAKSPEYQAIIDDFYCCLQYANSKKEVEEECSKLLKILKKIGGACKRASSAIKEDILKALKNNHGIEFHCTC